MTIKPSTALRNEYLQISLLARESGEPIFITNKGEADGVYMSIEAYEEREKMLAHRAGILAAEAARLAGRLPGRSIVPSGNKSGGSRISRCLGRSTRIRNLQFWAIGSWC